jgi:dihydrofolate reductase
MGSFVYYTATSLNGYIADENNSLQWLFDVGSGPERLSDFIKNVGVQVMGSSTYEWSLSNENVLETPGKWQQVFGDLPTRVYTSRSLPRPA